MFIIGDCNAHIGKDAAAYTFHDRTNGNGELLLGLAEENDLSITNVMFQKRRGKLWTYISDMNGHQSQIDYILVNRKWRKSVIDVEAYNSFSSLGSDHRILTATVKLCLRAAKTPPKRKPFDWKVLANDTKLQEEYTVTVKNKYDALCEDLSEEERTVTNTYSKLVEANNHAAKDLIPLKKRSKKMITANDPAVALARNSVSDAFRQYQQDTTKENQKRLQAEKTHLEAAYDEAFEKELNQMISKVESADIRSQHGESWKLINEISGRKTAKKGILKGKSTKERLDNWQKHFSELLGKEPVVPEESVNEVIDTVLSPEELGIQTGPFTMEEYQTVKKRISTGKCPGVDGITPEVLKYCDLDETILQYANKLMIDGEKPEQWSLIDIVPLPKSGDLSLYANYRGISLSSIVSKLVNRMLLNRIQPKLDQHLRPNQNGFRPKRSTTSHILALRRIIEGVKRNNLKAVLLFVDFSKAFDSVHRGKMMKILSAYGIPDQLVNAIAKFYENTKARVLSPDGETDYFEILAGVLQGDTLAPYLFAIVIDYIMRKAVDSKSEELGFTLRPRRSKRVGPVNATDFCFADDIVLLANEIAQAKELLHSVENEAAKVGLHINAKKTEAMEYNQDLDEIITSINNHLIKLVEDYKYLGGWMESTEQDIKVRIALAWAACNKLGSVWKSKLTNKIKVRLFVATVETVLLYNSNTWTLTSQLTKRLDGTYTRLLRKALNVSWKQHMTNVELYGELPPVSEKIAMHRLRLAGHCVRHKEEMASDLVLWEPTHGRPSRGRKHLTYIDTIRKDTGLMDVQDIRNVMLDRNSWREVVKNARQK